MYIEMHIVGAYASIVTGLMPYILFDFLKIF